MTESLYRLKKEAVKFMNAKFAKQVLTRTSCDSYGIDDNALEEVKRPYLSYGIKTSETANTLAGWSRDEGAKYHFTIVFPSMAIQEHDKFVKGKLIRDLMNDIQGQIDRFARTISDELEK